MSKTRLVLCTILWLDHIQLRLQPIRRRILADLSPFDAPSPLFFLLPCQWPVNGFAELAVDVQKSGRRRGSARDIQFPELVTTGASSRLLRDCPMGGKLAGPVPHALNEEFDRMVPSPSGGPQGRPSDRRAKICPGIRQVEADSF